MAKTPPVHEQEFLKLTTNHSELTRKLGKLSISSADILEYAKHICSCWFKLGEEHLKEANSAMVAGCFRAVYSRSYYAAYNASKAIRYLGQGFVSLKGDDHADASSKLPADLPSVAEWSQKITLLYEHRLHADYDNWSDTNTLFTLTPVDSIATARDFIGEVRTYAHDKFGMTL